MAHGLVSLSLFFFLTSCAAPAAAASFASAGQLSPEAAVGIAITGLVLVIVAVIYVWRSTGSTSTTCFRWPTRPPRSKTPESTVEDPPVDSAPMMNVVALSGVSRAEERVPLRQSCPIDVSSDDIRRSTLASKEEVARNAGLLDSKRQSRPLSQPRPKSDNRKSSIPSDAKNTGPPRTTSE